ncbi:MAG: hypothetical protein NT094_02075 [Candidatus Staskawiczbacteria bacterium]|nr:hypothetical protein [Candidatus Staskawiczbacteria bacterium]
MKDTAYLGMWSTNLGTALNFGTGGTSAGFGTAAGSMILRNGNLGIGTGATAPEQKLTVNGNIGILEGGSGPTYYTIFQGGNQSTNITYTLPTSYPIGGNKTLQSDISGILSWSNAGIAGINMHAAPTDKVAVTPDSEAGGTTATAFTISHKTITVIPHATGNTCNFPLTYPDVNVPVGSGCDGTNDIITSITIDQFGHVTGITTGAIENICKGK